MHCGFSVFMLRAGFSNRRYYMEPASHSRQDAGAAITEQEPESRRDGWHAEWNGAVPLVSASLSALRRRADLEYKKPAPVTTTVPGERRERLKSH